ncbi:MAG: hypothetical protein OXT67_01115 [Zetaproteobacteria bacterium]|nr:hypothetical protein [Zetaproteobacteria bacterium]
MSFQSMVMIGFLSVFVLSLSAYFYRDQTASLETLVGDSSTAPPRIRAENFVVRRYIGLQQVAQLSAMQAALQPPRTLVMRGQVKGWQLNQEEHKEVWRAENFEGELNSGQLEVLSREGELEFVELSERVVIARSRYTLYTDRAYYSVGKKVYGSDPIRVVSAMRWLTAENGFDVNLENDSFRLYGQVKGVLYPDE